MYTGYSTTIYEVPTERQMLAYINISNVVRLEVE